MPNKKNDKDDDPYALESKSFKVVYSEETRFLGKLTRREVSITMEEISEDLGLILDRCMPKQPTPQEQYRHLYILLAWGSGFIFLAALLAISVWFKDQTPQQLKTQAAILAISAAAFAVVITGLLNVKAKVATQLIIGASGAFGVLVLFYLVNPAIIE